MKKNKMMRIASVLLVAVLLSTCAISGTYAKYITTASGSETARVAKWGFGTTELTLDLFKDAYQNVTSVGGDVVAPGTTGTYTITLIPANQFKPEVAYEFDADINYDAQNTNNTLFGQIEWAIGAVDNNTVWGDFATLQAAINDMFDDEYAPNTLPTANVTISWRWAFDDGSNDVDTELGNNGEYTIKVDFTFTATQVD